MYEVSTGSGSDRVKPDARVEIAAAVTRSLTLPVLTSSANWSAIQKLFQNRLSHRFAEDDFGCGRREVRGLPVSFAQAGNLQQCLAGS